MPANPGNRTYRCSDGEITVAIETAAQWRGLAISIGRPELAYEGDWETIHNLAPDGPVATVLEEHFAEDTADSWLKRLEANGVPCRLAPI